jgi:hypothetical protein
VYLYARGRVTAPLRLYMTLAALGAGAAALRVAGVLRVPGAVLAAAACLAVAAAVNRRFTRPPHAPRARRIGWIAAAALTLAALPPWHPQPGRLVGFLVSWAGLVMLAALLVVLVALVTLIVRGIVADPGDRLLPGALAAIVLFVVLWATTGTPQRIEWTYAGWVLAATAAARASGNVRRP